MEHNIFQEIEEDLERQKFEALWKKYGSWIILVALGLVVSTASSTAYRSWKEGHDQKLTSAMMAATASSADAAKNIASLEAFAKDQGGDIRGTFALLRAGAAAAEQNDKAKAIALFDSAAANPKADRTFRQLATLLSVQAQLDDGNAADLDKRLQPLALDDAPWRYSAREAQALLALRSGDGAKAKTLFTSLAQDKLAPPSIMARATDILRTLN